jgi:hypothetical protein
MFQVQATKDTIINEYWLDQQNKYLHGAMILT